MTIIECESDKCVLLGPEWNDSHTINTNITFKKAMTGKIRTYIKKPTHIKSFTLSGFNRPACQTLCNLLINHYGKRIAITENAHPSEKDSNIFIGTKWYGTLTSPVESIHQGIRNNKVVLNFEDIVYA